MKLLIDLYNAIKKETSKKIPCSYDCVYISFDSYTVINGHFLIRTKKPDGDSRANVSIKVDTKNLLFTEDPDNDYMIDGCDQVIKQAENATFEICLDSEYLYRIAKVLTEGQSDKRLILKLNPEGPCKISSPKNSDRFAVIMPCKEITG